MLMRVNSWVGALAAVSLVGGGWFLYGQDLGNGLPKFYFKVSGNQLDLGVDSGITVNLRSQDGKAVKTIEAKPDGGTQISSFNRDGKRVYQIQDSFDGTSQLVLFEGEREKVTIKLSKEGIVDMKMAAMPKESPTETAVSKPVVEEKPEIKPVETGSVLKK